MDNGNPHLQYLGCIGRQGGEDSPVAGRYAGNKERIRGIEEKLGKTTCGTGRLSTTKTGIGCKDDNGKRTENTIHSNKTDERGNKEAGYQGIKYSFTIFAFSCTLGEKLFLYNLTF